MAFPLLGACYNATVWWCNELFVLVPACSLWYVWRIMTLGHSHMGIGGRYMWVFIASD